MEVSIIIPFHRNRRLLHESIAAARTSLPGCQLIVAADGAIEDIAGLASAYEACVVELARPCGPATARNRGVASATGTLLIFVDADVIVSPGSLTRLVELFTKEPSVAAAFGAYDLDPPEQNFMSQYKNLGHAYTHRIADPAAATFWAGLGAMRASVFREVGGFDERFRAPSVEDIELGYRVTFAGYHVRVDARVTGTHMKRWTLIGSIKTDVWRRGVPWTQLLYRDGTLRNDLNTSVALRASVVVSYALLAFLFAVCFRPSVTKAMATLALALALVILNAGYYRWFMQQRGVLFGLRVIAAHWLHHLCNGLSLVVGTALFLLRRMGLALPGSLPLSRWAPLDAPSSSRSPVPR